MTDYCKACGEAEAGKDKGKYVEFEPVNGGNLYIEVWVCDQCCVDYYIR